MLHTHLTELRFMIEHEEEEGVDPMEDGALAREIIRKVGEMVRDDEAADPNKTVGRVVGVHWTDHPHRRKVD